MLRRGPWYLTTAGVLGASALLMTTGGCEDEASAARQSNEALLAEASREFEGAMEAAVPGVDVDKLRTKLRSIATTAKSMPDAEAGQKAAGALLAAAAQRQLAILEFNDAAEAAERNRAERRTSNALIDATLRLNNAIELRRDPRTSANRRELGAARDQASRSLSLLSDRIGELDGPIGDSRRAMETNAREAAELKSEALQLRRDAEGQNPADALPNILQAIDLQRSADRREYENAQTSLTLTHELEPEYNVAMARADQLRELINQISQADGTLRDLDAMSADQADLMDELADGFRTQVDAALQSIDVRTSGDLNDALDSAEQAASQALTQAKAAARGGGRSADGAKLETARILQLQGEIKTLRARDLAGQRALVSRLADAGGTAGGANVTRALIEELTATHATLVAEAKTAFEEAKAQVENMTGTGVEAFAASLANAATLVEGGMIAEAPGAGLPLGMPGGGGMTGMPKGAETLDDLVAFLSNYSPSDANQIVRLLDEFAGAQTESTELLVRMAKDQTGPALRLQASIVNAFGEDAAAEFADGMTEMSGMQTGINGTFDGITIVDESEQTAELEYDSAMGPATLTCRAIGGRWFVVDGLFPGMSDMPPAQIEAMAGMMSGMKAVLNGLADRIDNGDFATMEELQAGLMEAIAEMAGGLGGGGGFGAP